MADDFEVFVKKSRLELQSKQSVFAEKLNLLSPEKLRYEYNKIEGWIRWIDVDDNTEVLRYRIASVGSYDIHRGTWQWSWSKKGLCHDDLIALIRQISILPESFPDNPELQSTQPFSVNKMYGQDVSGALVKLLDGEAIFNASESEDSDYWIYLVLIEPINLK